MKAHSFGAPSQNWGSKASKREAESTYVSLPKLLLLRPAFWSLLCISTSLTVRISAFRKSSAGQSSSCWYLLLGKWNAAQTNCQDGFASQGEINIEILFKKILSQHNACQNCLFLMKSNVCCCVALKTANYFLHFEVPDNILFDLLHVNKKQYLGDGSLSSKCNQTPISGKPVRWREVKTCLSSSLSCLLRYPVMVLNFVFP
jgi:hypothetical protein